MLPRNAFFYFSLLDLVGGSIDWSVIREKEQPELKPVGQESFYLCENDTAKNWAKFITSQSGTGSNWFDVIIFSLCLLLELNHIARVSTKLAQADPIWLKEFLDADGLLYIYSLLHTYGIQALAYSLLTDSVESFSLNKTKTIDSEKETELAKLIILIMNTQSAAEYVIRENELVMKNIIVLVLGSNNNTMKIMVRFLSIFRFGSHFLRCFTLSQPLQFTGRMETNWSRAPLVILATLTRKEGTQNTKFSFKLLRSRQVVGLI